MNVIKYKIIRFGYTECSKNLLKSLLHFFSIIMTSQISILKKESTVQEETKKNCFLSVKEYNSIPFFLILFSFFIFMERIIFELSYLLGNANTGCDDEQILKIFNVFKD